MELINLVKRYNRDLAVDNVSLKIEDGEIFGLLGPNGAGKSTIIKMIMGLLKPNSGEITVNGMDITKKLLEIKKILGLVPQDLAIYDSISARENVEYFGKLYGLRGKDLKSKVNEALKFTGLLERHKVKPKKFSGGMKRRLNIACAIMHNPKIIIMDEPTVGIDPQSRNHILEAVRELNKRGVTILYTSHYMEEAEAICDRIGIIDHGRLIALGTKEELKGQIAQEEKLVIEAYDIRFNPIDELKKIQGIISVIFNENTIEVLTQNAQQILQDVLFILSKENVIVRNIALKEPDLESLFLSLTGRTLRD
ncbi:MAG: ABC transporter ATP-binding protein [Clostridia bacterium]|nr:ABC transporter ATP-binding protein [Clostridia bacterium]